MYIFEPSVHAILQQDRILRPLFHSLYNIKKKKILRGKMNLLPEREYMTMYQNLPLEPVFRKDLEKIRQVVPSVLKRKNH